MKRYRIGLIALVLLLVAIAFRLIHLQVLQHDLWAAQAQKIQKQEIVKTLQRGRIYDRNGVLLAEDIPAVSIALDNSQMTRPEKLQQLLKKFLGLSDAESHGKVYKPAYFTWLKRHVDLTVAEKLRAEARAHQIQGLIFLDDFRRSYPQRELASNLIGFTNTDNAGIEGAELQFDAQLKGTESLIAISAMGDRSRTEIKREILRQGVPGKNIYLTLDSRIQQLAEKVISEGTRRYRAKSGFVVVINVQTGEVEAMAQSERYNLNQFKLSTPEQRKNLAITTPFEPGSSAKIFTMLAALEADPSIVNQSFDGGATYRPAVVRKIRGQAVTTYPRAFRNSELKGYGKVTPKKIIQESINTAMIQIAYEIIGPQRLYEHLLDLGFAQKTGIELPGEITGYLKEPDPLLQPTILGDLAIGQAFSVTGIQLVTAVSAIANGGILLQPEILLATEDSKNRTDTKTHHGMPKLIAHRASTDLLTEMMNDVVRQGTGIAAQVKGYEIAAKSGTAQKAIPGEGYVKGKYTSLFVGFLPSDRPQYAIVVVFDEVSSKEYYGGRTAGPVFREIAEGIIRLKEIPPSADDALSGR